LDGSKEPAGTRVDTHQQDTQAQVEDEKEPAEGESKELTGHDETKADGAAAGLFNMGVDMSGSGFPNMVNMNMNTSFNNPVDYNQMMQYMSANGMGNFNNMMGS
jgi:hypothetical protein